MITISISYSTSMYFMRAIPALFSQIILTFTHLLLLQKCVLSEGINKYNHPSRLSFTKLDSTVNVFVFFL